MGSTCATNANKAFILVKTLPKQTAFVYNTLKELQGVKEFNPVTGRFDALVEIQANTTKEVSDFVCNKIRTIDGVKDTETLIVPTA